MSIWGAFSGTVKDMFGKSQDYEDEYYGDEYEDAVYEDEGPELVEEPAPQRHTSRPTRQTSRARTTSRVSREPDISTRTTDEKDYGRFSQTMMPAIAYPKSFKDVVHIFEALNEGKITLVDVSAVVKGESKFDEAQRICDYLGGVCHAFGLATTRVNNTMYMITPYGCDILDDLKSGNKNKVFDFFKTGTK